MRKKYFIITYGCQANVADSERISAKLEKEGYKKTSKINDANWVVINSCSVRQSAVNRVYGKLRNLKGKKIILAGCLLEHDKRKFKDKVEKIWHPDEYFDLIPNYHDSQKAYIPIMTGCNNFCTYCAVPYTRGRERSRPANDIINEVKKLINPTTDGKYKEIWLLGQNVNSYPNFPNLLRKVNKIDGNFKIYFMSPHPKDFSDDLIKAMKECNKFSNSLNLPVQAGNDEILKKMNRPYTVAHYKKLIRKIRKILPNIKISTDVIVGFPGETKKQFQDTIKLFQEIKFDSAYINKYSPRPGTVAAKLKDNVPPAEKKRRWQILNEIANKK